MLFFKKFPSNLIVFLIDNLFPSIGTVISTLDKFISLTFISSPFSSILFSSTSRKLSSEFLSESSSSSFFVLEIEFAISNISFFCLSFSFSFSTNVLKGSFDFVISNLISFSLSFFGLVDIIFTSSSGIRL